MRFIQYVILVGLALPLAWAREPNRVVILSDIHFNPLASSHVLPKLLAAAPSAWESILNADPQATKQEYKADSAWTLFASVVAQLKSLDPKPKLVIVTGDVLPHKFSQNFAASQDPAAFRDFVRKTITFVGLELQMAARGAPVIYTLGNNDDECGDYALEPNGPFLKDSAGVVQALAHSTADEMDSWESLGSYVTVSPLAPHHRIIALNSTYLSNRYQNTCGAGASTGPGALLLDWLSRQLQLARQHGDKVWIVYHIPPGIDGHTSAKRGQVVPLWIPAYAERFNGLLDQYGKTIALHLAGHTHLDDFRLVQSANGMSLVLINPGVSPNIGQSPAYRIMTIDAKARPLDLYTYYLPDLASGQWKLEYSAREALKLPRIDTSSYQALYREIEQSPESINDWRSRYAVLRPSSLDPGEGYLRSLYCATGHTEPTAFEACIKTSATSWNGIPVPH